MQGNWKVVLFSAALVMGCQRSEAMKAETVATSGGTASGGAVSAGGVPGAVAKTQVASDPGSVGMGTPLVAKSGHELAAFAGGCFWGTENTFRHVPGVVATAVGYTGGSTERPTYESVCSHRSGHAEAVLVEFDPAKVSYAKLLGIFFRSHDPTTKNRQGPDVGDQYRSAVFTFSDKQREEARAAALGFEKSLGKPVTTEIAPLSKSWKAEDYHQQYDEKTGRESCPLPSILNP